MVTQDRPRQQSVQEGGQLCQVNWGGAGSAVGPGRVARPCAGALPSPPCMPAHAVGTRAPTPACLLLPHPSCVLVMEESHGCANPDPDWEERCCHHVAEVKVSVAWDTPSPPPPSLWAQRSLTPQLWAPQLPSHPLCVCTRFSRQASSQKA